jgi:choline dehydrogenase-like flavoprotein
LSALRQLYAAHAPKELRRHYDAVIIGSGPGACAAAYRLAHGGRKVLVVERGDVFEPDVPPPNEEKGWYLNDHVAAGENASRFLGGQSRFYGAAMYRMRASDFAPRQHETGISPAWPFDYSTLEPYYGEAERLYSVHGDPPSDPTEPPRSASIPHGPLPHSPVVNGCVQRLQASGTVVSSIPRSIDYGPSGKCVLCPTCDAYACSLDAKFDAENSTLRPALGTGNLEVALRTECLRLLVEKGGDRVLGAVLNFNGAERAVYADQVLVGAGLTGTVQLLWQSRTAEHPEGIGNSHGNLGRNLGGHWTGFIFPLLSWRRQPANHTKTFSINTAYDGASDWPYPLGIVQVAGQMPYWRFSSRLTRLPARLLAQRSLMCFYMIEAIPDESSGHPITASGVGPRTDPRLALQTFEKARQRAAEAFRAAGYLVVARRGVPSLWHEVGTARMGVDPRTSVCNADGKVHGMTNLYLADASVLPSAGAVNTCLTIVAVALKTADAMLAAPR